MTKGPLCGWYGSKNVAGLVLERGIVWMSGRKASGGLFIGPPFFVFVFSFLPTPLAPSFGFGELEMFTIRYRYRVADGHTFQESML